MKFGPVPVAKAKGGILAHSLNSGGVRLKKGCCLNAQDIAAMQAAGIAEVTVAMLETGDLGEDTAATALAAALAPTLPPSTAFAGRVNIYAPSDGLFQVDSAAIARFNDVTPAITVATLPEMARVTARTLVATVKIIPYAVPEQQVEMAKIAGGNTLGCTPYTARLATLVLTKIDGMKGSLLTKGERAVTARLRGFGCQVGCGPAPCRTAGT